MTTTDAQFESELEVFRSEVQAGTQCFYAYLAVHAVAADHKSVHRLLNQAPLFWNTCLGALQTAAFVALGRVFDQDPRSHNLDRLLRIAQENPKMFSKEALARRKQGANPEPPEWLDNYLQDAYVPTKSDFLRIRAHVTKKRKIYDKCYRHLRNKVFAHKEVTEQEEVSALFARTNIRELQRLFTFLDSLHGALWQLFINGQKPVLRPLRYSVKQMRALPSPAERRNSVQERITFEAEQFLRNCLAPPREGPSR